MSDIKRFSPDSLTKELFPTNKGQFIRYVDHRKELESQLTMLVTALKGVIRVADRATVEFDFAKAAITKAETEIAKL